MALLHLSVIETRLETQNVRRIVLVSADGSPLPAFSAGASIAVEITGIGRRKYSLVNAIADEKAFARPDHYTLGIRLADDGQGGSRFMHGLKVGDCIKATMPENDFALEDGMGPVLLVAGGIGVTPLVSKAAQMKAQGRPFRFAYAARSLSDFAFLTDIEPLCDGNLLLHDDASTGKILDLVSLLQSVRPGETVHICGPRPMLNAAISEAREKNWPAGTLQFETFYSSSTEEKSHPDASHQQDGTGSFEIEIKSSGLVLSVPPEKSIVDVLNEAGLDPLYDCNKGECGVCQTGVLAGQPDHRDFILTSSERAANKQIHICVSRAKSARLVLDL